MKSVVFYTLKTPVVISEQELMDRKFTECGEHDASRSGWSPTVEDGFVMDMAGGVKLLNFTTQSKTPNKAEVKRKLALKVDEYEEQFGSKPKKADLVELEAKVIEELLPLTPANEPKNFKVVVTPTMVYVEGGYKQAEDILANLRSILGSLPVVLVSTNKYLPSTLTDMVKDEINTDMFVLGDKVSYINSNELKVSQTSGSVYGSDAVDHMKDGGAQVTTLQLEYNGMTLFTLKDDMSISGIKFSQDLKSTLERNDKVGNVIIEVTEVMALVGALIEELGGLTEGE